MLTSEGAVLELVNQWWTRKSSIDLQGACTIIEETNDGQGHKQ